MRILRGWEWVSCRMQNPIGQGLLILSIRMITAGQQLYDMITIDTVHIHAARKDHNRHIHNCEEKMLKYGY